LREKKIPEATVMRLAIYTRYLKQLLDEGIDTVSSSEIAEAADVDAAKVRKDLDYFGEFGTRGVGYKVDELYGHLLKILGLHRIRNVILLGAGRLGSALALYPGFADWGFRINTIIDVDPQKIGKPLGKVVIEGLEGLERKIGERDIEIAIISVPGCEAQGLADRLVAAGIKAILNFSPQVLKVPEKIVLKNFDMSAYLKLLSFHLSNKSD